MVKSLFHMTYFTRGTWVGSSDTCMYRFTCVSNSRDINNMKIGTIHKDSARLYLSASCGVERTYVIKVNDAVIK